MSESKQHNEIDIVSMGSFSEKAYLDYSMDVILDRALPFIGDGLKPVHRRILFAMSELGLGTGAKPKKSARTVGDVLGKYHPHGDAACYEAMVLMAQSFSYRYPFIDGQGNWGSQDDPKSFAAMRYTEARLSPYAELLLNKAELETVPWGPNFDGSMEEPKTLPARVPNLLLNGSTGIAVGMATDIPPHNLREVVRALIHLIDHPQGDTRKLCEFIPGPDYPTGAEIITPAEEITTIYETGRGRIKLRATYTLEDGNIIINTLPYQVSQEKVIEQISEQINKKRLPMISDIRNNSDDAEPVRIVIVPRGRTGADKLMNHLFATTDLERSYKVNLNVIGLSRKPGVKSLAEILAEWLIYRTEIVRRRLENRLAAIVDRLHILDGYLIAYLNIDEVIRIIRTADDPKEGLIERFALSERQAEAVLQLRLRNLARLEEIKIRKEQQELAREKERVEAILASEKRFKALLKKELQADADRYGDDRRTPMVARKEAREIAATELIATEPVTVILSRNGWVRSAKGHEIDPESLAHRSGDSFLACARGINIQPVIFMDSAGRTYSLPAHTLPSARSFGEPLTVHFSPPAQACFMYILMGTPHRKLLLASSHGYGFLTEFRNLPAKGQKGKSMLTVPRGALPLPPLFADEMENTLLVAITSQGRMIAFPVAEMPVLPKGKGNKIIDIPPKKRASDAETVSFLTLLGSDENLLIHTERQFKRFNAREMAPYLSERGRRGKLLPKGYQNVRKVEKEKAVDAPEPDDGSEGQLTLF